MFLVDGAVNWTPAAEVQATLAADAALQDDWSGYTDTQRCGLADIAAAHERLASGAPGRTLLPIAG